MARINTGKKKPWIADHKSHGRRKSTNQSFYNSTTWRKLATFDKKQNPYCVDCVKELLEELIKNTTNTEKLAKLKGILIKVDESKRGLDKIVIGFTEAPSILARSNTTGKRAVTDHIKPINEGGEKLNPKNFQTLCDTHHNQKSGREAHKK